ncbi:MAG: sulfatase, partial [Salinigranum sp.]
DHGELHGEHDLYGHEFCLYDPLVNVPLMIKHPDLDAGRRADQVELVDLYHTVLDALDVEGGTPAAPDEDVVGLDRTRSLLSSSYREFDGAVASVDADAGSSNAGSPNTGSPNDDPGKVGGGEYAFVEYSRPVVELKQLEEKAKKAGVTVPEESRFYSRMRAARRPDAKYVRISRIADEAYRLDDDPEETNNLAGAGDERIEAVEAALAAFETNVGGAWDEAEAADVTDDTVADMDEAAQERLRDLGYME